MLFLTTREDDPDEKRTICRNQLLSALATALISTTLTTFSVKADEPLPVWFHPSFSIESVADTERNLAGPIPQSYQHDEILFGTEEVVVAMWLHEAFNFEDLNKGDVDERVPTERVRTCAEFIHWANQDYWPIGSIAYRTIQYPRNFSSMQGLKGRLQYCRDIAAFAAAKPATESFVRDYFSEETGPKELFELLWDIPLGCNELRFTREPEDRSIVFHAHDDRYSRLTTFLRVRLLSLADFDNDGLEDMLVGAWKRSLYGGNISDKGKSTYLLSRNSRKAPLRVALLHHTY